MARITEPGKDYIILCEDNIELERERHEGKVHLIELNFREPDENLVGEVLTLFHETRRYIISNYIRFYNFFFKKFNDRKYYVSNVAGENLIIFFKRNNKVLLDITILDKIEREFILRDLGTILEYLEVIKISKEDYENNLKTFQRWKGNAIILK